jgi:prolyl oligopeptidase
MNRKFFLSAMALSALIASNAQNAALKYPTPPSDNTVDNYFGISVKDPYRPLENDTAAATLKWVEAENAVTRQYLDAIPFRADIHARLTTLNNFQKTGRPSKKKDGRYYFFENDGLKNQAVLYRANLLNDDREIFLDPNALSTDGTVALTGVYMSPDGRYTAYTISRSGSDWTEIYVMETETKELLDDHIMWAKFTDAAWDGDGFYYSAYEAPEAGKEFSNANTFHKVFYHKIGTPQSADVVAYEDKNAPLHFHSAQTDSNQKLLAIAIEGQGNGNALVVKQLGVDNAKWITVEPTQNRDVRMIDVVGDKVYFYTSVGAEKYRVVAAPVSDPRQENWVDIIPESKDVLVGAQFAGDKLIVKYDQDAANHAFVYTKEGKLIREIAFPGYGSAGFSTSPRTDEVFYSFTSFTSPSSIYSYDMESGESTLVSRAEIAGFNPDDYVTEQVFYTSKDGTKVPMFITYRRDLKRDGKNPVYLYGYGGFNITLNPSFSANRLLWLENGGIYAQANLRGGGEYGEPWHLAGTKMEKMNVFDDFIAAAEYMIKEKWTKKDKLVIEGGSNGGLLVGACANLRPDLFAVAIPRVGVMDMMRYHLFTIGWNWAHDYGTSADSKEMAEYLLSYSPLHTIKSGKKYPAIMVTTADHDDRVVPAHSFKYAATLQKANTGKKPKLIRIDSKAGHGAGKPIAKVIDEYADIYSFIFKNMNITPNIKK